MEIKSCVSMKYSMQRAGLSLPDPAPYSAHLYTKSRRGSGVGQRPLRWRHAAKALAWRSRQRGWWRWGGGVAVVRRRGPQESSGARKQPQEAQRLGSSSSLPTSDVIYSAPCGASSARIAAAATRILIWSGSGVGGFFFFFPSSLSSFRVGNLLPVRKGKEAGLRARKKDSAPVNSGGC